MNIRFNISYIWKYELTMKIWNIALTEIKMFVEILKLIKK